MASPDGDHRGSDGCLMSRRRSMVKAPGCGSVALRPKATTPMATRTQRYRHIRDLPVVRWFSARGADPLQAIASRCVVAGVGGAERAKRGQLRIGPGCLPLQPVRASQLVMRPLV